jgi:hypothetical protein
MSANRSGDRLDDADAGSWASETLPLSTRRELLQRELKKLGLRKAPAGQGPSGAIQQQQAQPDHPQADEGGEHAD